MRFLILPILMCVSLTACADEPEQVEAPPPEPDAAIAGLLDELEYKYSNEDNGDFRLLFDFEDGRSQLVWIRNKTFERDGLEMRDVWSTALELSGRYASVRLADRLLRDSWETVLGNWAREGDRLVYMVKVPALPSVDTLRTAINQAIELADELEEEYTDKDDF